MLLSRYNAISSHSANSLTGFSRCCKAARSLGSRKQVGTSCGRGPAQRAVGRQPSGPGRHGGAPCLSAEIANMPSAAWNFFSLSERDVSYAPCSHTFITCGIFYSCKQVFFKCSAPHLGVTQASLLNRL